MKQSIVVRNDIDMRRGKMCAQVAHASVKSVLLDDETPDLDYQLNKIQSWLEDGMSKVVLKCNSEDELLQLAAKANENGLMTTLIRDAGLTQVEAGTLTCLAIGPDEDSKVDEVTKDLKLL